MRRTRSSEASSRAGVVAVRVLAEAIAAVRLATPDGSLLRAQHAQLGPVDLVLAGAEYQYGALSRVRRQVLHPGLEIPLLAVEDILIHKLIAGRARDLADVESILDAAPGTDLAHLEHAARAWDVLELLRRLQAESAERITQRRER